MDKKKDIVVVVEQFFNVKLSDLIKKKNQTYPFGVARSMMIFMLKNHGNMTSTDIAEIFDISPRSVFYHIRKIKSDVSDNGPLSTVYAGLKEKLNEKTKQQ